MSQKLINLGSSDATDQGHKKVLAQIRETYGNTTQILVSNEELCELAAVCAKFPRYTDPKKAQSELHSKAIDEVADVMIILDHVINIFQLDDAEIQSRIQGKIDRIQRWLSKSSSQEQTTIDREVREGINTQPREKAVGRAAEGPESQSPCTGCDHVGDFSALMPGGRCWRCCQSGFSLNENHGVGHGYRVRHQADPKSGSALPKEDYVLLLFRAHKMGKEYPDEVVLSPFYPCSNPQFSLEEYGMTWEAVWP